MAKARPRFTKFYPDGCFGDLSHSRWVVYMPSFENPKAGDVVLISRKEKGPTEVTLTRCVHITKAGGPTYWDFERGFENRAAYVHVKGGK